MHIICQTIVDHNNSIRKMHIKLRKLPLAIVDSIGNCASIALKNTKILLR